MYQYAATDKKLQYFRLFIADRKTIPSYCFGKMVVTASHFHKHRFIKRIKIKPA